MFWFFDSIGCLGYQFVDQSPTGFTGAIERFWGYRRPVFLTTSNRRFGREDEVVAAEAADDVSQQGIGLMQS
jgi:hypothetical protein